MLVSGECARVLESESVFIETAYVFLIIMLGLDTKRRSLDAFKDFLDAYHRVFIALWKDIK